MKILKKALSVSLSTLFLATSFSPVLAFEHSGTDRNFGGEQRSYHTNEVHNNFSHTNVNINVNRGYRGNNGGWGNNWHNGWHNGYYRNFVNYNGFFGFWYPFNGVNIFVSNFSTNEGIDSCEYLDTNGQWVELLDSYGNPYCP